MSSRLVRATLVAGGDLRAAVLAVFAWTALLSEDELGQFADEMDRHLWSATELGRHESLLLVFNRWRETAEAYAAGMPRGLGEDLTWLDDAPDVAGPEWWRPGGPTSSVRSNVPSTASGSSRAGQRKAGRTCSPRPVTPPSTPGTSSPGPRSWKAVGATGSKAGWTSW